MWLRVEDGKRFRVWDLGFEIWGSGLNLGRHCGVYHEEQEKSPPRKGGERFFEALFRNTGPMVGQQPRKTPAQGFRYECVRTLPRGQENTWTILKIGTEQSSRLAPESKARFGSWTLKNLRVLAGWSAKAENRGVVITEAGSYSSLTDSCITELRAQRPSRTCNESKDEEEGWAVRGDRE